jgi:localization factor PodJL
LASAAPAKPGLPRASSDDLVASGADRATPLDIPIEPGTGRPGSSSARPATSLDGEAGTDSKADFIAAARRAARAAEEQSASALQAHREAATGTAGRLGGFKAALAARRKPIMLAIIAALVGIAALQAVHVMKSRHDTPQASVSTSQQDAIAAPAVSSAEKSSALPEAVAPVDPVTVGSIAMQPSPTVEAPAQAMPLAPDQLQALKPVLASINSQKLREAALSGEPDALYEAGIRYIDGKGIEADPVAGTKLLEAAARLGSAPSEYRLGSLYREGKGVTADKAKALDWFKQAAEGGNARAMHNAGVLMAEGVNGAPDYTAAADWFRRASELNVRDSQYNLAILYARGLGVKQDLAASYVWFNAAAGQGDADAGKKRDEIAGRMQPSELTAAKATAAGWKAKPLDPRANEVTAPEGGWDVPVKTGAAKQKGGKA